MNASLHEMLKQLAGQLPGCLHTSIIDGETGMALASASEADELDAAGADAFHTDLYRLGRQAVDALPATDDVEQIVITSDKATCVSLPVQKTGYLWLVIAHRDATVGFIQALMRKHVGRIEDSLQALLD